MISTQKLSLQYGKRILFEDVSLKFTEDNCYGLIGPNGAGKSTFLKILAGEIDPTSGAVVIPPRSRMSVLKQDHFAYNDFSALETVLMGHERLYEIMQEKDAIYAKPDFGEADGLRAAQLEEEFGDLNGWEAESQAGELLDGLGIPVARHGTLVRDLDDGDRVRVLLAQAVFAEPDILLLDEPTNHLDVDSILWLEEFLLDFKNTVIVVSHDRHFLNRVCTHTVDIDFQKIQVFTGNYDFWKSASELALRHRRAEQSKNEDKAKELKAFIQRFSANASKSRQATARKKMLDQLNVDAIPPSSRKYPHIIFQPEKVHGKQILKLEQVEKKSGDETLFTKVDLTVTRGEKIVLVSDDSRTTSTLLDVIAGAQAADSGSVQWNETVEKSFFPKDNAAYFENELSVIDWLRQYSEEKDENFIRTFLGRMLFTGQESKKSVSVLSGGEKVRCMVAKLMLEDPQCMVLDGPTNHLDLESIVSLNNALIKYTGTLIFASHDVEFIQSLAERVIEITPEGIIDHQFGYEEFLKRRAESRGLVGAT